MYRARLFAVIVLLVSYGAVGARQPAVRSAIPLPVPARTIADAMGLPSSNTATLLLHLVRLAFDEPDRQGSQDSMRRTTLRQILWTPGEKTTDVVPLPLDPSIWRETLLQSKVADDQIVAAILTDRRAALLYHGLFALDDATLAWLGPDRETLLHLRNHPGLFAAFGRSVRVRAGRIVVPGGADAESLWEGLTGVSATKPAAFVQRLFGGDANGWLAFMYDTMAHLDGPHQRFALGLQLSEGARDARLQSVLDAFSNGIHTWRPERNPFSRPPLDASVLFSTVGVTPAGDATGPTSRRIWEHTFHNDERLDVEFSEVSPGGIPREAETIPVDAAWLAARIADVPYTLGRRRLDTLLFAQRVFGQTAATDAAAVATALRGFIAFPALMIALERIGTTEVATFVRCAEHAKALGGIHNEAVRRTAIEQFQGTLGIIERAHRSGALTSSSAQLLVTSLCGMEVSEGRGYDGRLSWWFRGRLVRALPVASDKGQPVESTVLAAMAGPPAAADTPGAPGGFIEWEGRRYRVDPVDAELRRLRQVRRRQGGQSLDAALQSLAPGDAEDAGRKPAHAADQRIEQLFAETLASVLYAAYLGDPDGRAVISGNVALRHDFGVSNTKAGPRSADAWRLPIEDFGTRNGWRVRGALLGLEAALGRLALKRLDSSSMPAEPKLSAPDRQMVALTVALLNPFAMSDAARDEIASALARGRARAAALTGDPAELDRAARDGGLSEWRRQALAWTVDHERGGAAMPFSLVELFWLGSPRPSAIRSLDAWGAAVLPLTGCLCLRMPAALPWEEVSGRSSTGLLATRAADVALQVADALASLQLPAALAPYILGFAMQDVTELARPAYAEDWDEFERAALDLKRDRLTDYVAALTAGGPLVPADLPVNQR